MKYRLLPDDTTLEVGDVITVTPWGSSSIASRIRISRVTKRFAFARVNEASKASEIKFPRVTGFWFTSLPRESYPYTEYRAWRPM